MSKLEGIIEFYPIPSEPREPGWNAFKKFLPLFLDETNTRPSQQETRIIHRLVTTGIILPDYPQEILDDSAVKILIRDKSRAVVNRVMDTVQRGEFSKEAAENGEILEGTKCKVFIPRRGHLRQLGHRITAENPRERIFASHAKPFFLEDGTARYYSLNKNIDELFNLLGKKYDELLETHKDADLDTKLMVIVYFQIYGAALLHPFWDANGRTFAAKLVLDLNRIGIDAQEIPQLGEINKALEKNVLNLSGEKFVLEYLERHNIPLIPEEFLKDIQFDPHMYQPYMDQLEASICNGIEAGIDQDPQFMKFLESGAYVIRLALSRDGLIDDDIYQREAPGHIQKQRELEAEQKNI
jgi:hypothetical protein